MGVSEWMEQDAATGADLVTKDRLVTAFRAAQSAHHEFEEHTLKGQRDEQWAGWYAGFVVGRLGDIAKPSELTEWLQEPTSGDDWHASAAENVLKHLKPPKAPGR
ncbi:MAG TPA: hypothetical protein VEF76_03425 [Patescibacteria group bacterium]|nr:hypothetical protein [Patescibacteria group bacterium]